MVHWALQVLSWGILVVGLVDVLFVSKDTGAMGGAVSGSAWVVAGAAALTWALLQAVALGLGYLRDIARSLQR